jgi:hypothetical protein
MKIQLSKYLSYAPRKRFWRTPVVITAILAISGLWIVWPDWKPLSLSLAPFFILLLFINGFQYNSEQKKEDDWKKRIAQSNQQFKDHLKRNQEGLSKENIKKLVESRRQERINKNYKSKLP